MTAYSDSARDYLARGWWPIPLPPMEKDPPPSKFTGWSGAEVTVDDVERWIGTGYFLSGGASFTVGNIAIRLPGDIIGIDVDAYAGGVLVMRALLAELGALPPTVMSTSRDDGDEFGYRSGIRFYRVPMGTVLVTNLDKLGGPGVQIVQFHHRYAVCEPSVHPEGRKYLWIDERADEPLGRLPDFDDIPELPTKWVERLRDSASGNRSSVDPASDAQVAEFIQAHTAAHQPHRLEHWVRQMVDDRGGRHDALVTTCRQVIRDARAGAFGADVGLRTLEHAWGGLWSRPRPEGRRQPHPVEFAGAIRWAVGAEMATVLAPLDAGRIPMLSALPCPLFIRPERPLSASTAGDGGPGGLVALPLLPTLPEAFYERESLHHIRQAAHSRGVAADSVLIAVLARVAALIPPALNIPPMVGSKASFDFLGVVVGRSSAGKSVAMSIARELIPVDEGDPTTDGIMFDIPNPSGEGLLDAAYEMVKPDPKSKPVKTLTKRAVHFSADEGVGMMDAAERNGTTIISTLCSAWSGAPLGNWNATIERRRIIPAGRLRISGVMGIQFDHLQRLMTPELISQGFSGRLVLLAAEAEDIPPPGERPEWSKLLFSVPSRKSAGEFGYDQAVADEVMVDDWKVRSGKAVEAAVDGHLRLCRLKVAGLLAVLEGRTNVDGDDWRLAGMVVQTSTAIRDRGMAAAAVKASDENRRKGHADGERAVVADDVKHRAMVGRVAGVIERKLQREGGVAAGRLRSSLGRDSEHYDEVVEWLIEGGKVVVDESSNGQGKHVRWVGK